jgi:hypothetical protein
MQINEYKNLNYSKLVIPTRAFIIFNHPETAEMVRRNFSIEISGHKIKFKNYATAPGQVVWEDVGIENISGLQKRILAAVLILIFLFWWFKCLIWLY